MLHCKFFVERQTLRYVEDEARFFDTIFQIVIEREFSFRVFYVYFSLELELRYLSMVVGLHNNRYIESLFNVLYEWFYFILGILDLIFLSLINCFFIQNTKLNR